MLRNLLIVEDDASLRQMLVWELEDLGYRVSAAGSCGEALALAGGCGFDLALLDYSLPDGNGIDLAQKLRKWMPGLPVIMNSGVACPDTRMRALEQGVAQFFSKPASAAALHRAFQGTLNQESLLHQGVDTEFTKAAAQSTR